MDNLGFWNVRGLNRQTKQAEIQSFMMLNKVCLFGLLETRVKPSVNNKIIKTLQQQWSIATNYRHHRGGRIWLLWKPSVLSFNIVKVSAQMIHGKAFLLGTQIKFWVSMCYGLNDSKERKALWQELRGVATSQPWIVLGDFNNVVYGNERIGAPVHRYEVQPFQSCLQQTGLRDMKQIGKFFTWNNKQEGSNRVWCKLDRAMVNDEWCLTWSDSYADFRPEGLFDHSPCIVSLSVSKERQKRAFKFYNMWTRVPEFDQIVQQVWCREVRGVTMYSVITKLSSMKRQLRELNHMHFSEVEQTHEVAKHWLYDIQMKLGLNPGDQNLRDLEREAIKAVKETQDRVYSFLTQKAKVDWMGEGDTNTAFFHASLKMRRTANRVLTIKDMDGQACDTNASIEKAFLTYYQHLLGRSKETISVIEEVIECGNLVNSDMHTSLLAPVKREEVREAVFSIPDNKAPGLDGYSSAFYKKAWPTIGDEVCKAVQEFFTNGRLLTQINATNVVLIPKNNNPHSVLEFRPIACCNVIYKLISKVLCGRLSKILPDLLCENQSAFTQGRSILGNILICQDLVRLYKRKTCSPRCLFKIDLKKAYDTVEWSFVDNMLRALRFPTHFITMVMSCVSTPSYTFLLNGSQFGFLKGKRGLRQGDPLSPLIFTICMNYLSRVLRRIGQCPGFKFHPLCSALKLNHLCFTDDLVMFCKGHPHSMDLLIQGFTLFSKTYGLEMNKGKSDFYVNGVTQTVIDEFKRKTGMVQGNLPFRYLGVPVSTKRLGVMDCEILIEKIVARIRRWGARKLSYMGRLTLVKAVLHTLHLYWAQIFVLPASVIKKVDAICRNYLWEGHTHHSKGCSVAWDSICTDRKAGGLGLMNSRAWNVAAIGKLAWWVHSKADHVWVRWVHHIYLKGEEWLSYIPRANSSWCWRKICEVKERIKDGLLSDGWLSYGQSYTIQKAYRWIQGEQEKQGWTSFIWSRYNVPRHMFIGWLAVKNRLATMDRMVRFGITNEEVCLLCLDAKETIEHLFFECTYSRDCVSFAQQRLGLTHLDNSWKQVHHKRRGSKFQKQVLFAFIVGYIYHIWKARNECRVYSRVTHPRILYLRLKEEVRTRVNSLATNLKLSDSTWFTSFCNGL